MVDTTIQHSENINIQKLFHQFDKTAQITVDFSYFSGSPGLVYSPILNSLALSIDEICSILECNPYFINNVWAIGLNKLELVPCIGIGFINDSKLIIPRIIREEIKEELIIENQQGILGFYIREPKELIRLIRPCVCCDSIGMHVDGDEYFCETCFSKRQAVLYEEYERYMDEEGYGLISKDL
ncbi:MULTISPECIES: hypothetical protein [Bacillus cereus group]|uniref:Uncharacterized protein n=1 Tax=Bacillus thuringiensis serovar mexicanensis TaxID=180868 RepID=A0A242W9T9_BACTU|nr:MULTISPECIES: hypothetical protein [Bacillus cereus group]EEM56721.1 hypothetical protein bthur0007_54960 [Bacillus thuringiensis serovar monterrey BGSC 4AJ1]MEB9673303.1 hypothetical protein [Bacillus anthracis]OTW50726.1 hypothetical protein BK699_09225 [Bacillus thuringiensis serovar mexicanensis]OTX09411.1 hypothetical protein BK705_04270 [Bacillus thuringiensis serovar monterrey]